MVAALGAEELLASARERTGLADFGDPIFREGLDALLEELKRAELHDLGRMVWRGRILGHLVQRLRVEDWLARHPEIDERPVPAPIFVVGLPRSRSAATVSSSRSLRRASTATRAPSSAIHSAAARPIPLEPPVSAAAAPRHPRSMRVPPYDSTIE